MSSVLIAEDHPVVVIAIRILLQGLGYKEIYEVSSGAGVVPMIRAHQPDLVLLDLGLDKMGGLQVLEHIKAVGLVCKTVVFTSAPAETFLRRCRYAGAMAFVDKSADLKQLENAIKAVRSGYCFFPAQSVDSAGQLDGHSDEGRLIESLSDREMEILKKLAQGISNKQIAAEMNRSHKTISTYKTRLMLKLGIKSTVMLREIALRHRLL
ncbi:MULTISPECIES: response regulator transcription factor [Pseudomonas]|uniref:response regulator transcription factor n=1 Tax=Pseudomonas TaxID=286 RepID=UPI001F1EF21B|nr:response regulator transcription factor [Pseudomonas sputi]